MAGVVKTVGDLLENIEFLDAETPVVSENGRPLFVGLVRKKVNKFGESKLETKLVIYGELKEITRNSNQINAKKQITNDMGGKQCPRCKRTDTLEEVIEFGILKFVCSRCMTEFD